MQARVPLPDHLLSPLRPVRGRVMDQEADSSSSSTMILKKILYQHYL